MTASIWNPTTSVLSAPALAAFLAADGTNLIGYDFDTVPAPGSATEQLQRPVAKQIADFATISSTQLLVNNAFTGSAANWTLANFTYGANAISHVAGTVGTAQQTVALGGGKYYRLQITVTTTTRGRIDLQFNGTTMLDDAGYYMMDVGTYTFPFPWLGPQGVVSASFGIITDTSWAGSIDSVSITEVTTETTQSFSSIATGDADKRMPYGVRFGAYETGQVATGDRRTLALSGSSAAWNVANGVRALEGNVTGIENTANGAFAGRFTTTDDGTYTGYSSCKYNTLGQDLSFHGYKSGFANTVGSRNGGNGKHVLFQNSSGNDNQADGYQALYNVETTNSNTANGSQAGLNCRGSSNVFNGADSGLLDPSSAVTFTFNNTTNNGSGTKVYGNDGIAHGTNARVGSAASPVNNSIAQGANVVNLLANAAKVGVGLTKWATAGRIFSRQASNSDATAAGITYTVDQFITTALTRTGPGAPYSDTTPTAAALVAAMPGPENMMGYEIWIRNATASVLTLLNGVGVTLGGTTTIAANSARLYKVYITNAGAGTEAVDVIGIGAMGL